MKVRAALVEQKDGPFVFRDVDVDAHRSDEIVVRLVATGVCHRDARIGSQATRRRCPSFSGTRVPAPRHWLARRDRARRW